MIDLQKIFWYSLLIFLIVVAITLVVVVDQKLAVSTPTFHEKEEKLSLLHHIDQKIDYFHYDYLDRYLAYQEKNPNLSDIDIITQVNLGLDQPFYENTKQSNHLHQTFILVNKYLFLPEDYIPNNLVEISKDFSNSTKMLVYEAKENFEKMCQKAKDEGYTIRAISAYRSYDYQKQLYDNYVLKDGVDLADTYSARPGYSEHQTGLVVDVDNGKQNYEQFEQTKEFSWMQENAHLYGFILRYPKEKEEITGYQYESWHYRYVGKEIASILYHNHLTLDEYFVRYIEK